MWVDPLALPWLIDRPRMTELLAERWQRRVVTVVAGPGFGKSTAVAAAMRNTAALGVGAARTDYLVRVDASRGSAARFAHILATALQVEDDSGDPVQLVEALAERAGEHCLIFDDVHELTSGSAGERALAGILERLPANVGLVLVSRSEPSISLARLRASGQVFDIREADLAYDPAELRRVADVTGTEIEELQSTSGWPALVSLVVNRGHRGAWEYLAEEVLTTLDTTTRDALMVAARADGADPELLRTVAGYTGSIRDLATVVPLVTLDDAGRLIPHSLWTNVFDHHEVGFEREALLRHLVETLLGRNEPFDALRVALRLGDRTTVARVVRALCAAEYIGFDTAGLSRLLEAAPLGFSELPEGRLLSAILATHRDPMADSTRLALETSIKEFRRLKIVDCEVVALSELAMVLHWQGRSKRLLFIVRRLFALADRGHTAAARLAAFARAVIADRSGDSEKSLAAVADLRRGHLHDGWIALVEFVRCHQLLNLGRIREAHDAATRSRDLGLPGFHGGWCSVYSASWHLGVTRARIDCLPFADDVADASPVDQVWIGAWFGAMQAYAGRHEAAARNIAAAERALHARHDSQLIGFVAWARAAMAIAEHDESRARQILRHYLRRHRITSPLGQRFAARAPAMFDLLLADELPAGWPARLTGPWQQSVLAVGATLRSLRSGIPVDSLPDPGMVLCALPLPWAVEFAARADIAGHSEAVALAGRILDVSGDAVRVEIERFLPSDLRGSAELLFAADRHSERADPAVLNVLTARERRVLEEVSRGLTNQQIATGLGISVRTVANHLYNSYAKLGVASRTEAALLLSGEMRQIPLSAVGDAGLEPTTSSV